MHACMSNVETSQHCVCLALYTPNSTFVMTKKNDWGTLIELCGTRNVERLVHAVMVRSIMSLHESFGFDHSACTAVRLNHGMMSDGESCEEGCLVRCTVCEKLQVRHTKCAACWQLSRKRMYYCSKTCQKRDWSRHRSECAASAQQTQTARSSDIASVDVNAEL